MCSSEYPPLSARVVKTTSPASSSHLSAVQRPKVYKEWSVENMEQAYQAVMHDGVSIRRAAVEYNIPRTTLADRVQGRVLPGSVSGKQPYLSPSEEIELVTFILRCADIGFPRGRKEIIALVQRVCDSRGLNVNVTHGWWERFCHRHDGFSLRIAAPLSHARRKGANPAVLNAYFDMLEDALSENDLADKPCQIFNMDETGMPLDPRAPKLLCKTGSRSFVTVSSGDKSQITVVGCVSAAGYCIPPMVIYDRQTLQQDMSKGEVGGTLYGLSKKGWIDQELCRVWFKHHFLRYAPPTRPLLLLMDGHSTHYCPETINCARAARVVLFTLPPNTTHVSQPLDKGCFGPLKAQWRSVCHEFLSQNPGKSVTRFTFSELFAKAWMESMTLTNIVSGFRQTGIYPVNRSKLISQDDSSNSRSGLPYVPVLTPAPRRNISKIENMPSFNVEEMAVYHQCASEDSFTSPDCRYNKWREMYRPKSLQCSSSLSVNRPCIHTPVKFDRLHGPTGGLGQHTVAITKPQSTIQHFLQDPGTPLQLPQISTETKTSRILTSSENIRLLAEKKLKKEEAAQLKEAKQHEREHKRLLKQTAVSKSNLVTTCYH